MVAQTNLLTPKTVSVFHTTSLFMQINQPIKVLQAVPMSLYSTYKTLQEVLDMAESKLPIATKNDLHVVLMSYHNSLLHQINQ